MHGPYVRPPVSWVASAIGRMGGYRVLALNLVHAHTQCTLVRQTNCMHPLVDPACTHMHACALEHVHAGNLPEPLPDILTGTCARQQTHVLRAMSSSHASSHATHNSTYVDLHLDGRNAARAVRPHQGGEACCACTHDAPLIRVCLSGPHRPKRDAPGRWWQCMWLCGWGMARPCSHDCTSQSFKLTS